MILLILAILHCAILPSSPSVLRFHGTSEYGVMHDDRLPVQRHSIAKTTMKSSSIDEDISLNLPHSIDENTMTSSKDHVSISVDDRKLPILRGETEGSLKPAVQPQQTSYVLIGSTEQRLEPQREIVHVAEAMDVSHHADGRPAPQREVVLRNTLTEVEVIPKDVVPIIVTTTATPMPTTVTTTSILLMSSRETSFTQTAHAKGESGLLEQEEERGRGFKVMDELPSAKTFILDDAKAVPPLGSTKDDFSALSKEKSAMVDEMKAESSGGHRSHQRSKEEEEDAEALPEFDEKTEAELEFHETDVSTTPSGEFVASSVKKEITSSISTHITTPAVQGIIGESSDSDEKDFFSEDEIYDLVMFIVTLLPEVEEQSRWSKIIAGLQCALRDCRRAFPRLTTVATPVGNGTFIIRRARSECLCSFNKLEDAEF